jgi:hypothetical protein
LGKLLRAPNRDDGLLNGTHWDFSGPGTVTRLKQIKDGDGDTAGAA